MHDFKTDDWFQVNDGSEPPLKIEVTGVASSKVYTATHMTVDYKQVKRNGETHKDTFQQLIENGYLTKIQN